MSQMSVLYKFKSSKGYDSILFDGQHISVMEVKQRILTDKCKMDATACPDDLVLTDASTNQDFLSDTALIPKNTSLIVTRMPSTDRRVRQPKSMPQLTSVAATATTTSPMAAFATPLPTMQAGMTEEERLNAARENAYAVARGSLEPNAKYPYYRRAGPAMESYHKKTKAATGIPRSLLTKVDAGDDGAMKLGDGTYVTFAQTDPALQPPPAAPLREPVPDELACPVCAQLLRNAVSVPCCDKVFCEECIRNAVTTSPSCPSCKSTNLSCDELVTAKQVRLKITEHLRRLKNPELYATEPIDQNTSMKSIDTNSKPARTRAPASSTPTSSSSSPSPSPPHHRDDQPPHTDEHYRRSNSHYNSRRDYNNNYHSEHTGGHRDSHYHPSDHSTSHRDESGEYQADQHDYHNEQSGSSYRDYSPADSSHRDYYDKGRYRDYRGHQQPDYQGACRDHHTSDHQSGSYYPPQDYHHAEQGYYPDYYNSDRYRDYYYGGYSGGGGYRDYQTDHYHQPTASYNDHYPAYADYPRHGGSSSAYDQVPQPGGTLRSYNQHSSSSSAAHRDNRPQPGGTLRDHSPRSRDEQADDSAAHSSSGPNRSSTAAHPREADSKRSPSDAKEHPGKRGQRDSRADRDSKREPAPAPRKRGGPDDRGARPTLVIQSTSGGSRRIVEVGRDSKRQRS